MPRNPTRRFAIEVSENVDSEIVRHNIADHLADHFRYRADLSTRPMNEPEEKRRKTAEQLHRLKLETLLYIHDLMHNRAMRHIFIHQHVPDGMITHIIEEEHL